jgi:hypothetical protein
VNIGTLTGGQIVYACIRVLLESVDLIHGTFQDLTERN